MTVGRISFGHAQHGIVGRQSDTRTAVDNHYLRAKVATMERLLKALLAAHGERCECQACRDARLYVSESGRAPVDVLHDVIVGGHQR